MHVGSLIPPAQTESLRFLPGAQASPSPSEQGTAVNSRLLFLMVNASSWQPRQATEKHDEGASARVAAALAKRLVLSMRVSGDATQVGLGFRILGLGFRVEI